MKYRYKLSRPLRRRLHLFFRDNPPHTFSNALRRLLLDYMQKQVHTGFPVYIPKLLYGLSDLFDVLDMATDEKQRSRKEEDPDD